MQIRSDYFLSNRSLINNHKKYTNKFPPFSNKHQDGFQLLTFSLSPPQNRLNHRHGLFGLSCVRPSFFFCSLLSLLFFFFFFFFPFESFGCLIRKFSRPPLVTSRAKQQHHLYQRSQSDAFINLQEILVLLRIISKSDSKMTA